MFSKQRATAAADAPKPTPVQDFFRRLWDCVQERITRMRLAWEEHIITTRHGRSVDRIMRAFELLGAYGDERDVDFLIEVAKDTNRFKLDAFHALANIGGERALAFLLEQLKEKESEGAAFEALQRYKQLHPSPETDAPIDTAIAPLEKKQNEMIRKLREAKELIERTPAEEDGGRPESRN